MPEPVLIIDRVFHARLAGVASVSNRVIARKLEQSQKKGHSFFFCSRPCTLSRRTREETLATQANARDRFRLSPKRGNKIEGVVLNRIK